MKQAIQIDAERAAELFHALADPTRIDILNELSGGERCVCELTESMDAAQSRLSFHLKVLKDAGVIVDRREGRWMYYRIAAPAVEELDAIIESFRAMQRTRGGRGCC
ncbi:MAG: metalloregulator ArsR/SmtB family transcription factor [Nitrospiraceae bacterium]